MQTDMVNNLLEPNNNKYVDQQNNHYQLAPNKNFMNGLRNAKSILRDLERSIKKTTKYENSLLQCKASHSHSHLNEWCERDKSADSKCSKTARKYMAIFAAADQPRNELNLAESWSTMSIVCLQYQYEELSKKYESLLRAYDERRTAAGRSDAALCRAQQDTERALEESALAHLSLLRIGENYLALRERRHAQKRQYQERIEQLEAGLCRAARAARRARIQLDGYLSTHLLAEKDTGRALLLSEIRRSNRLSLENLKLKTRIEELVLATPPRDTEMKDNFD